MKKNDFTAAECDAILRFLDEREKNLGYPELFRDNERQKKNDIAFHWLLALFILLCIVFLTLVCVFVASGGVV